MCAPFKVVKSWFMKTAQPLNLTLPRTNDRLFTRPQDTDKPTKPVIGVLSTPSPTSIFVPWTWGDDSNSGIAAMYVEHREKGMSVWSAADIVLYDITNPAAGFTIEGLTNFTTYQVQIRNADAADPANFSDYSDTAEIMTPPAVGRLSPGQLSIITPSVSVNEGSQVSVVIRRSGAGDLGPGVTLNYKFADTLTGIAVRTGTLTWSDNADGDRTVAVATSDVSVTQSGLFQITSVAALSGNINPSVGVDHINVTIQDIPPSGSVLTVGAGRQYTTIAAAVAALLPGQIGDLYDAFNEGWQTSRNGNQTQQITIRAASGATPAITGTLANQGNNAAVHILHPWWVIDGSGLNLTIQGHNATGTQASWAGAADPERGIIVRASNTWLKGFKIRQFKQDWIKVPENVVGMTRLRITGIDARVSGTLYTGASPATDAADGCLIYLSAKDGMTFVLIEDSYFAMGGHACINVRKQTGTRIRGNVFNQDWDSAFPTIPLPPAAGGENGVAGQKAFDLFGYDGCVEDNVIFNNGRQVDNPSTQGFQDGSFNTRYRRNFLINSKGSAGVSALAFNTLLAPGPNKLYIAHQTVHGMTGAGIAVDDSSGTTGNHGPFHFINCSFSACCTRFRASKEQYMYYHYRSSRGKLWTDNFFVEGCNFDQNYTFEILDEDGVVGTIRQTLTALQQNFPNNFKRNRIGDPAFASTASPVSVDPATAKAQTIANFTPSGAGLIGTASPLTTIASTANASTSLTLVDAGHFCDSMGWSHIAGDDIYIAGVGVRRILSVNWTSNVITVDQPTTVAAGANVFLGTKAAPNIGAVL